MPRWSARVGAIVAFGALVLGSAVLVGVPTVSAAPTDDGRLRTLNTGGGTTADDGLQISYASGQLEVLAAGVPQLATTGLSAGSRLATGNHFALAVGDTIVSDVLAESGAALPWDRISASQSYGTIFSTLTPPAALAGFSVAITVSYTRPANFLDIQARVTVPEGTTAPVRLYWIGGSTLPTAQGYATADGKTAGAFTVLGTTLATYQVHGMEVILGEGFQYLVGPAACPYAAVAIETCPGGSGFVTNNLDLPNLISDVPGAPVALALEYGPLAPGRTTVGFRLAFRTQAETPLPTTTLPPPVTIPPDPGGTTTTVPGGTTTTSTVPGRTTTTSTVPGTTTTVPGGTTTTTAGGTTTTTGPGTTTTTTAPCPSPTSTSTTRPGVTTTTGAGTTTSTTQPLPPGCGTTTTTRPPGTTTTTRPTTTTVGPATTTSTTRPTTTTTQPATTLSL